MYGACVRFDDPMRTRRIEPDRVFPVSAPDGELKFIAVPVLFFAAFAVLYAALHPADFAKRVFYEPRFEFQLRAVTDMLQLTAAAFFEHGTLGTDAFFGGRQDFFDLPVTDPALLL